MPKFVRQLCDEQSHPLVLLTSRFAFEVNLRQGELTPPYPLT
jgi:hypothetical protein